MFGAAIFDGGISGIEPAATAALKASVHAAGSFAELGVDAGYAAVHAERAERR